MHGLTYASYDASGLGTLNRTYAEDSLGRIVQTERRQNDNRPAWRQYEYYRSGALSGWYDYTSQSTARTCTNSPDYGWTCQMADTVLVAMQGYQYDAVGNQTTGAVMQPGGGNRYQSYNGYTLGYDADGNLTSKRSSAAFDSLEWNSLGQLVRLLRNGSVLAEFGYDALGRRAHKTAGGVTTQYVWDGDLLMAELDAAGNLLVGYSYLPGSSTPYSVTSAGQKYYVASEELGSITALVRESDYTRAAMYSYAPFGTVTQDDPSVRNSFRWQGLPYDAETGLYSAGARYYDPALGRFISEDPIGLAGGINLYAYAGNDPGERDGSERVV